jgi:hypothetical protein
MKIYRSSWEDEFRLTVPTMDVIERELGWRKTGLLDQNGTPLMVCDVMEPIGFVTNFERPPPAKNKRKRR